VRLRARQLLGCHGFALLRLNGWDDESLVPVQVGSAARRIR
jgi:hypothetical protein